jgi:cbb3-type cytochrome oxidase maturation protein
MEILYLLIPLSVVLVFLIGLVFWWSLRSGQYDDLEGPGYRVLMDDDRPDSAGPPERRAAPENEGDRPRN